MDESKNSRRRRQAVRAYMREHDVSYTSALRAIERQGRAAEVSAVTVGDFWSIDQSAALLGMRIVPVRLPSEGGLLDPFQVADDSSHREGLLGSV